MRRKLVGHLCAVCKGILFIGFSIQIVLGLIWMCSNFTSFQEFARDKSIVYGAVYALCGKQPQMMYLLQLTAAFLVDYQVLRVLKSGGTFGNLWGTLALLTFPMAMQCHMAVLPWSFAGSLFLLELSFAIEFLKKNEKPVRWVFGGMALCWLSLAVLLPEYRLFGGIPVLLTLLFGGKRVSREPKKCLYLFAAAGISCALAVGAGTAAKRASGIEDRSLSFTLACRMAWPSLWSDRSGWPEEVQKAVEDSLWETTYYPDNMDRMMKPLMEETFGKEKADAYFRQIAENAWTHRTSAIVRQMVWDVLGYGVTPVIMKLQLEGRGYDSYTGRNYEIMRNHTPLLTKYYVDYSCWWFPVCIVLAMFSMVLNGIHMGEFPRKNQVSILLVCVLSAAVMILCYTMRGTGLMDYKMSFAASSLWLAFALPVMREEGTNGEV